MNNRDLQASVPIVVAAAIIQQEEKFLLTRRKPESDLGGLWEFPGGKKEPGETLRDCLRREVKEELGVEISEPQHFHSLRHQYPEKQVELHFFTCCIINRLLPSHEYSAVLEVERRSRHDFRRHCE